MSYLEEENTNEKSDRRIEKPLNKGVRVYGTFKTLSETSIAKTLKQIEIKRIESLIVCN